MTKRTTTLVALGLMLIAGGAYAADDMRQDSMAKDSMAKDGMTKDSMAKDTMSKDDMAKPHQADGMAKDTMAKETMPKDSMAKDANDEIEDCPLVPTLPRGNAVRPLQRPFVRMRFGGRLLRHDAGSSGLEPALAHGTPESQLLVLYSSECQHAKPDRVPAARLVSVVESQAIRVSASPTMPVFS